jgi:protein-S-isoprenylcysteine O-methyltransferase Ste14
MTMGRQDQSVPTEGGVGARQSRSDFGGVAGNLALLVALPIGTAYLYFCARFNDGRFFPEPGADLEAFAESLAPSWETAAVYLAWLVFQALLQAFAPGPTVEGTPLEDGTRLRYRMNGRSSLLITGVAFAAGVGSNLFPLRWIYDHFGELISVVTLFSYGFAFFLLIYGRITEPARNSRGVVVDYFLGAARHPRIPPVSGFDLKVFFEARPGLIGWMLVVCSFAAVQVEHHGSLSTAMAVVCALQFAYVLDYFWHEPAILTTLDVQHEKFGWMLLFGDLVWVPMTYSLQAHYLIDHAPRLPIWAAALCVLLGLAGMTLFRSSNLQKHRFRSDPNGLLIWGEPAEFIETRHGNRLLVSGFWGWSRHSNYLGDWLLGLAWSLACGFGSLLPYFYPIYFAFLLIHRERRDHQRCAAKYGEDWDRYCRRVRWRIVPGLY